MRAAVFTAPHAVEVRDVPQPEPEPDEVIVRVATCGICGTDQHIFEGDFFPTYPLIAGHEFAGEVVAIGDGVETVLEGDRVGVDPTIFCGHCFFCQRAQGNHCRNLEVLGVTRAGGFAEYVAVPKANVYDIGDTPYEEAAFIEPLSCAVHGLQRLHVPMGANALVYGTGPIGLLMIQLIRHGGGSEVAAVGRKPEKLSLARGLGAQHTVTAGPSADGFLREIAPLGFDVVIDCTGDPEVVEGMFMHVRDEGKLLFFGVTPTNARIHISPFDVYSKELEIYGSFSLRYTFHDAIALLRSSAVAVRPLLSERLSLEEFSRALELAHSGSALKVQVVPEWNWGQAHPGGRRSSQEATMAKETTHAGVAWTPVAGRHSPG